jgi:hypothetical protein
VVAGFIFFRRPVDSAILAMPQKTADLTEGFDELLAIAGERLQWGGVEFDALLRDIEPNREPYDFAPGEDNELWVAARRADFAAAAPKAGDVFTDPAGRHYRVVAVRNAPADIALRFKCQLD